MKALEETILTWEGVVIGCSDYFIMASVVAKDF